MTDSAHKNFRLRKHVIREISQPGSDRILMSAACRFEVEQARPLLRD